RSASWPGRSPGSRSARVRPIERPPQESRLPRRSRPVASKETRDMRSFFLLAATALLAPQTIPPDWREIRPRAEKLYAEGSCELAHKVYAEASGLSLPPEDARWLAFRLADTDWRSAAATDTPDTTRIERAKSALDALQRKVDRPEAKDEIWADVEE